MIMYKGEGEIYIKPDDVIPFSSLCLRYWPYKTGSKLSLPLDTYKYDEYGVYEMLPLFYLKRVSYQPTSQSRYMLCLDNAKQLSLEDKIANVGNLFFPHMNIVEVERNYPEYREVPPGAGRREDANICTEKNLTSFVARTIFEMTKGRKPTPEEEQKLSIPPHRLWTWLGPIDPEIPVSRTFKPNDEERQEIAEFLAVANKLDQTDGKCLARMLKYRYPNLSKTELYDFIYPGNNATDKQKDSQATRWGIVEESRRKKGTSRS